MGKKKEKKRGIEIFNVEIPAAGSSQHPVTLFGPEVLYILDRELEGNYILYFYLIIIDD